MRPKNVSINSNKLKAKDQAFAEKLNVSKEL